MPCYILWGVKHDYFTRPSHLKSIKLVWHWWSGLPLSPVIANEKEQRVKRQPSNVNTFTVCALEHIYRLLSQHLTHVFLLHSFVARHYANQGNEPTTLIFLHVYFLFMLLLKLCLLTWSSVSRVESLLQVCGTAFWTNPLVCVFNRIILLVIIGWTVLISGVSLFILNLKTNWCVASSTH